MPILHPYLNFAGTTEAAFQHYRNAFGGEFTALMRYGDSPETADVPEGEKAGIMHISLPIGDGTILMGTDILASMGRPLTVGNNVHITVSVNSRTEADRLFAALGDGGQATMAMDDTFWGDYFGMLTDRFGVHWMISCDASS